MSRPIPTIDMLFMLAESRDTPQHVAGVLLFDNPTAKSGWTIQDLVQRYRDAKPIYPFNVIPKLSLSARPRWVDAADMDMTYHVQHHALPAPGSDKQLDELVERWHSVVFDRGQPLFQLCIVEGVSNNRFAIYVKIHHSIIDGASAIARILAGVSADPTDPIGLPFYAVKVGTKPREPAPKGLVSLLGGTTNDLLNRYKVAMDLSTSFWKKALARAGGAPASGSLPFEAPMTLFNVPILHGRSFARVTMPLEPMRQAGKAAGGTLNDVAMALVDSAVHTYLRERKQPLDKRLLALVPVSLREPGDLEATTRISAVVVPMGDSESAMAPRLKQIVEGMKDAKTEVKGMSKAAAGGYSVALYALAQGLGKLGVKRPLANMVISNVPGANKQMYLGGSPMLAVYPVNVLSVGMGLSVTLVSNAGQVNVGVTSQNKTIPDPQHLASLMVQALEELTSGKSPAPAPAAQPVEDVPVKRVRKAPAKKEVAVVAKPRRAAAKAASAPAKKAPARKRAKPVAPVAAGAPADVPADTTPTVVPAETPAT
ncbi:wax ester/triacylglycerol synthase family O-acyltransferase [Variovorax rhizosphaerae]|uniref:diacylglycerol O-acyltransferase n=1 Tax=Variovorax rhizosphaerae TaxID=1836200 RepID=A0ABU8WKZ8_9BURK